MQTLFFALTLDFSIEFLFGESAGCLSNKPKGQGNDDFSSAFNYCAGNLEASFRLGFVNYLPDKKEKNNRKLVHEFVYYILRALDHYQNSDYGC